jgi:crotonobetainyl-CoA:carnitine CoA-transferase CaiB-like acyl-CoA transferase
VVATRIGTTDAAPLQELVVVDLSSLWAGPLCASLLGLAGARVVKVESLTRPDGARRSEDGFFDLLNGAKESVALDLATDAGRGALATLIHAADVVVESSRPRGLEQLGIVASDVLAGSAGPRAWVSITGHGRRSSRVAFGDDAAVAGGLVVEDGRGPTFCADAVADPVTGLVAAAAALEALAEGGRWLLDVAMAGVAASLAGPTLGTDGVMAAPPRARQPVGAARPLGADTTAVLRSL